MNEPSFSNPENMSHEEMMSALFASMVMQQSNMAMLYLGQVPHPETGQPVRDLDAAQMFIQQLEMLEVKTKGNLGKEEASLLKHSLSSLRMAFVQAVEGGEKATPAVKTEPAPAASPAPDSKTEGGENADPQSDSPTAADEERKKFVKKY